MQPSIEARTSLSQAGGFTYEVLSEEGSGLIRRKVLIAALDAERDAVRSADARGAKLTPDNYDFIGAASYIDRGISYDGNGRRIGMNTSGSLASSEARNLFLKGGYNFGQDGVQRLQLSYSKFKVEGKGEYIQVLGCRGPDDADAEPGSGTALKDSASNWVRFGETCLGQALYRHRAVFRNAARPRPHRTVPRWTFNDPVVEADAAIGREGMAES